MLYPPMFEPGTEVETFFFSFSVLPAVAEAMSRVHGIASATQSSPHRGNTITAKSGRKRPGYCTLTFRGIQTTSGLGDLPGPGLALASPAESSQAPTSHPATRTSARPV
jgi:hypothetical protein